MFSGKPKAFYREHVCTVFRSENEVWDILLAMFRDINRQIKDTQYLLGLSLTFIFDKNSFNISEILKKTFQSNCKVCFKRTDIILFRRNKSVNPSQYSNKLQILHLRIVMVKILYKVSTICSQH